MCDLADVVELHLWTYLFVSFVLVLYEYQLSDCYYNVVFESDGSLTTKDGE